MRIRSRMAVAGCATVFVVALAVPAGAIDTVAGDGARAVAQPAGSGLFGLVEIVQGRLLVSVRRPARLSVFANGRRLTRFRARRERVYEVAVHRRGRIRIVAVALAGGQRQTVILHVK